MSREQNVINGVILQKLQSLDQVLTELRSLGQVNIKILDEDWRSYERVDVAILVDMVNRRLADFERFRIEILNYVQR
jgi:hypothetical protein